MTIDQLLAQKGMTKYRLSKDTGIPYMTVNDICNGKTELLNCTVATVRRFIQGAGRYDGRFAGKRIGGGG